MTDLNKNTQEMFEQMKNMMPTVKLNKNGYEIRAQMLEMAHNHVWQDFHAKFGAFQTSITKEGEKVLLTKVEMPEVPGTDAVLDAAQKFYDFVNQKK